MTIDRLGPVDPVAKYNKTGKPAKVAKQAAADTVAVSEEARRSAALQQTADIVRATPDVRMDRVEEVKAKLQDPNYINDTLVESLADRLLDVFGV
ncbi:MAG: flagellar biosynthesis anti-sigma factor FlgM [Spirochaetaceae bacterium]|jgi:negative regulator of flagellin synthesis FlgM|nr:flagellar biosynthesis anti-sigma factor FlgM [Spirochaetaceae bacterium]